MARQRLGQHFLADVDWREQIARAIRVSAQSLAPLKEKNKSHCWIEIGAGHGEMTEHLASTGAAVYAVELDERLAAGLAKLHRNFPNVSVVRGDILETNIAELAAGRRVLIYGNLPYYVTSPILHHLFASVDIIDEMHIVAQLEVVERLIAAPGTRDYGYLSVLTQYFARPELVFTIPREAFRPPPEVSSALLTLRLPGERAKLTGLHQERFLDFVKMAFSQKRKTLVNNLRAKVKPESVRETLSMLDLRKDARAEQLSINELASIAERLSMV